MCDFRGTRCLRCAPGILIVCVTPRTMIEAGNVGIKFEFTVDGFADGAKRVKIPVDGEGIKVNDINIHVFELSRLGDRINSGDHRDVDPEVREFSLDEL